MFYEFPRIEHLDDVRPAIDGRDEFIIAERDWGYVVNYMVAMNDTFPEVDTVDAAIRRECRGLLFYPDGKIMARRLHKFFNVNERDETQINKIDLGQSHTILEKLDGSMVTAVFTDAGIRLGTKMGITEVSMQAETYIATHPQYEQFIRWARDNGNYTLIFEWCSRKQRIVVDYPDDRLVLIAARNTITGEYASLRWLQEYGEMFEVEVVKTYAGTTANMQHLIDETRSATGIEGYIIRFDTGHMVKIKSDEYVRFHKAKDVLSFEKNIVSLLVNEQIDDVKSFLMDEDRQRLESFETEFWIGIHQVVQSYDKYFELVKAHNLDRKQFALQWLPTIKEQDAFAGNIVFGNFDGKSTRNMVLDIIKRSTGSQTKIDEVRSLWGGFKWDEQNLLE